MRTRTARRDIEDDVLRLIFAACHPVLPREARVALTLRTGRRPHHGRDRARVPRRPSRRSRSGSCARSGRSRTPSVGFELPRGEELEERLASVLEVIYLVFNEGYAATAGDDLMRPRSLRGRDAARRAAGGVRAAGTGSARSPRAAVTCRRRAHARGRMRRGNRCCSAIRTARCGTVARRRGLAALERAEHCGRERSYMMQAEIAACHARASTIEADGLGRGSSRSTMRSNGSFLRRSSRSIARWRSRRLGGPGRGARKRSKRCAPRPSSLATTCSRARAPSCWSSSVASRRPRTSSSARHRSRRTSDRRNGSPSEPPAVGSEASGQVGGTDHVVGDAK